MEFTDLLADARIPPNQTMLLRHDHRGLSALKQGRDWFGSFISIQRADRSPVRGGAKYVAQFVSGTALPSGAQTAIFVGLTEIFGRWPWDPDRLPRLWNTHGGIIPQIDNEAVDFGWLDSLSDKIGTTIEWGYSPRSWYQWAHLRSKRIIEKQGNALEEALEFAPIRLVLSEEEKRQITLEYEDSEIHREIIRNPELLERKYRETLVEIRPEQDRFRKLLMAKQDHACAITGCDVPESLDAAHIVPFAEGRTSRDLASNGLLLRCDIHRLFDRHLISIDPTNLTIWLNPSLRDSDYSRYHGLEIETDASLSALKEHFHRCRLKLNQA